MAATRTEVANAVTGTWSSGDSTITFSGLSLGTADANRVIYAGFTWADSTVTSATIGGVSATIVVQDTSNNQAGAAIFVAEVPTGTTGDVVITMGGDSNFEAITLWRSTNASATADSSDSDNTNGTSLVSVLNVPAGGLVFAASYKDRTGSATWTGPTEDYSVRSGARDHSHASAEVASADATYSADCLWSSGNRCALASATFPESGGGGGGSIVPIIMQQHNRN